MVRLVAPGPVPVPWEVAQELAAPLIHHRGDGFRRLLAEVQGGLRWVCQTQEPVVVLTGSGSVGMEATLLSLATPLRPVVYVGGGKFSERWGEIGRAYGLEMIELAVPWGEAVEPARLAALLDARPDVAAVALSACETSTGVMHPVEEVARVVKQRDHAPQLWVDGITAVGVCDLPMDALGLDALVMGSQKVFALPPGLAMVAVREQTLATAQGLPRYSLDLQREWAEQRKGQTLFTPATGLLMALAASLRGLRAQGLEATWARHDDLAKFARAGLEGLGLRLLARRPASAVSAAWLPEGVDAKKLLARCQALGTVLADGQGPLTGKIVRIGHLGSHTRQDLILALANLGQALREQGALDDPSAGVRAALL